MNSDQTNLYAEQHFQSNPDDKSSRFLTPTTATEIQHFLTLYFLSGIVQKPKIRQYWSTDSLLQTLVFNQVMTKNRFQKILQFLYFADNYMMLLTLVVHRFKTVHIPSENISKDKELLFYKGRLSFKQYIPSKRARFGIKLFSLCEDSGYLWNSFVYLGKTTINEN